MYNRALAATRKSFAGALKRRCLRVILARHLANFRFSESRAYPSAGSAVSRQIHGRSRPRRRVWRGAHRNTEGRYLGPQPICLRATNSMMLPV